MQIAPNLDKLRRFEGALKELGVGREDHILLAVSGGPDSLALLCLASNWDVNRIVAATVDHRLRPESAGEAAFVSALCGNRNIPHVILTPIEPIGGNIQSFARATRYNLLADAARDHRCAFVATAHHANDQLETILMRLARGSGLDGMAAIRRRNGNIIRPLLGFSKSELEEICIAAAVEPVRDPSNDNIEFDRVAIRKWLASASHPFSIDRAARTAKALDDAREALDWIVDDLATIRIVRNNDEIQCVTAELPRELKRRLLLRCLALLDPELQPRGDAVERAIEELDSGKNAMIGNIIGKGRETWHFSWAPPRSTKK
ncbi:MAG: tRNA lysidine(34) synthetase TilS [Sphingomonadaceae bacterium]|nr:tRNA lysidine(34) synthetase TilS [Sphingomonadaceae bacterium]